MKPHQRQAVLGRMHALYWHAAKNAASDPGLAARQARTLRLLSTRRRIRMPVQMRMAFCKQCKSFMAPGSGSRIRVGGSRPRAIRVTCRLCGHTYRKALT